jgi:uncharacterized membrane protein YadS
LKHSKLVVKLLFLSCMLLCVCKLVNGPVALLMGFLFTYFFGHPYQQYNHKAVNWLLKTAVVGLGFGISLKEAVSAGKEGVILTISSIVVVLVVGIVLGRLLHLRKETVHLIAVGTAICGGSAIAASAPIIQAKEKDISIALGVVFLLNAVALLLFPFVGNYPAIKSGGVWYLERHFHSRYQFGSRRCKHVWRGSTENSYHC